ncbi:class I SAM-dependent methyltransferase [Lysinibacillus sp. FSL M8-0216]|uniref:tRNA (Cmo5U34)-methyltransferase n=1 Tax=Lysinibacillus fusiformis TaxID=28031 RepID=A0A1H9PLQ5_9BACI|nr:MULTISPECIES: class I SAM-dependent methyltransferase [Lysinibacillus]HAU35403.1 class I SAM-dependent methyltransferase [Lysinibacillus sp.]MCG7437478.1 class I SAM-dependent methyltransferase [Lysinibacillus fusiformis]MED4077863.1 class I SAM-dependent methyltransferase [Lysinibacillus fusiformis]MED4667849.1 class I SAM-dependent methyltransferase [Lysinibacillus fusiformis]QAS58214.1 class I SAM-dependent methyltransferase [Lysinibacillus sphaericus]
MKNPQHDWHNPNVSNYQNTIRQKISGYDLIYDMMTDILQSYPTDNMLIVGAGGGQELFSLGQAFPFSHFTAIDTSKIMLQAARKHIEKLESPLHIDWYEEDLLALVFDHQFEVASCHLVSHFIEEHEQKKALLQKLSDSLQDSGILFISSINADMSAVSFQHQLKYWRSSMLQNDLSEEHWLRFEQSFGSSTYPITLELLTDLLHEVGFSTVIPYFKSHMVDALLAIKEEVNK